MNFYKTKTLYLKEIKDTFRDKSTILTVFILPLVLYPLLFIVSGFLVGTMEKEEEKLIAKIAVVGLTDHSPLVLELKKYPKLQLVNSLQPMDEVKDGKLLALIAVTTKLENNIAEEKTASLKIFYDEANRMSVKAKQIVLKFLDEYKQKIINTRLEKRGLSKSILQVLNVEEKSVASARKMGGFVLGVLIPYLLVVLLYTAAMNTATDITTGEKERKTIETLLVSNIARQEIVLGKIGAVMTVGLISAVMGLIGLIASFYTGFSVMASATTLRLTIAPIPIFFALLMLLPIAGLFSAILLMLGSFARSVKESNSYASYLLIGVALLGMTSVIRRGAESSTESFLIPVMNTTLVQQELLMGTVNWPHIGLTILTTGMLAVLAFLMAVAFFLNERVLFRI